MNFEAMSLDELKAAISSANGQVQRMNGLHTKFAHGATVFASSGDQVVTARNRVSGGWDGKAHDAASQAMTTMHGYMTQSQSASTESASSMQSLAKTTEVHHREAQAVPKVDTSFHASMRASGGNPFAAVVDNMHRHNEAQANHEQAVRVANSLNEQGITHANTMRSADWPEVSQNQRGQTPPDLPPPPGAPSSAGGSGGSSPYGSAPPRPGGGAVPVFGPPGGRGPKSGEIEPPGTKHPPKPGSATPQPGPGGAPTTTAGAPTLPGAGAGAPGTSGTPIASGPVAGSAGAGSSGALAGAGIGAAGGAFALGLRGGPGELGLAGRGGAALDSRAGAELEGHGGARGGLAAGEEPGVPGARGGLAAGEEPGLGMRGGLGSGGTGAGEGAPGSLRGGYGRGAAGADPLEGRPGAGEPPVRMGSGGLGASDVAAERGGLGPMGGGRRRSDDDEEQALPDYLVETNDAWAGDQYASPAVIGE